MRKEFVYIFKDPRNHIPFYVGKGSKCDNGYERCQNHIATAKRGSTLPVHNKIRKLLELGMLPEIEKIAVENNEQGLLLEIKLIKKLGRRDLKEGPLLNLTDGGDGKRRYKSAIEKGIKTLKENRRKRIRERFTPWGSKRKG
jgi:hypothetical protein